MIFKLQISKENIRNIEGALKLKKKQVLKYVQIDPEHLKEKDNWYRIGNTVQYFKNRTDCRIIGELLSKAVMEHFGRVNAQYEIGFMGESRLGLLSPNIQQPGYQYYDVSTLHQLFPELPRRYREYTLKSLLETLKNRQIEGADELIQDIITVYTLDWFTHQLDRNPKNLLFEQGENQRIHLSPLIDSESSFAVNREGHIDTEYPKIWIPAIPYEDPDFKHHHCSESEYDENMFSLMAEYPDIVIPILKQLSDENFDSMIQEYRKSLNGKVYLEEEGVSFLKQFVYRKQEASYRMTRI